MMLTLQGLNIIYWQEEDGWLGYLQEYPGYWTQGETLEDLKEHLRDLYRDVTSGEIPGIRGGLVKRIEELSEHVNCHQLQHERLAVLLAEYEQEDGPIDSQIMEEVRQEWPTATKS